MTGLTWATIQDKDIHKSDWRRGAGRRESTRTCRTAHKMLGEIAQALGDDAAAKREFDAAAALGSSPPPANGVDSPMARPQDVASNERIASQR